MKDKMLIRNERKSEYREVENLVRESFWNVYRPGCTEHFVLKKLRNDPDFVPELDFVMEKDGKIIGQNVFVRAEISLDGGGKLPIMAMGPICIAPEFKRQGYGKILLDYSLEKAKEFGCKAVCFEGNIKFYGKSGFVMASTKGIRYHGVPEGETADFFLCKELEPGYFDGITGVYATPKGYFVADENPEAFAAYEATFPAKEKHLQEGQLPQFCQSCGMPLTRDEDCGKDADGSVNFDYCRYCYEDGRFVQDCTMEEMIEYCAKFVDEFNKNSPKPLTVEEYKNMMRGFFPMLKRWKRVEKC